MTASLWWRNMTGAQAGTTQDASRPALAKSQSAAETVGYHNRLYAAVLPLLSEHGGYINKFKAMGSWRSFGTPERHADPR